MLLDERLNLPELLIRELTLLLAVLPGKPLFTAKFDKKKQK